MPFIEVKSGGPDIPDGVYPVILTEISDPKTVTAQRGPKAGQEIDLLDWSFAIESGPYENTVISVSTSMASGPRSKMFAFLTALFGGVAPPIGTALEKGDIVGRSAIATVQKDDEGWLRIVNLGALPAGYNQQAAQVQQQVYQQPAAVQAPAQAAPAADAPPAAPTSTVSPLREQVAAGAERKLPF